MKTRVFLIHGTHGRPDENWFPWLSAELRAKGYEVVSPEFPTPKDQSLFTWKRAFWRDSGTLNENTILVGHSIGAAFILHTAMTLFKPIKGVFLVSPFISKLGNSEFDSLNESFLAMGFDWSLINKNIGKVKIYHSDNDPYVPLSLAEEVAQKANVPVTIVKGAGHFNEASGYLKFEMLLADILKI
jgi:uncharacterized protein